MVCGTLLLRRAYHGCLFERMTYPSGQGFVLAFVGTLRHCLEFFVTETHRNDLPFCVALR